MVFDKSSAITDATSALKALLSLPSLTKFNNVSTMTVRAVNNLKKHEQFLINPAVLSFYQKLLINTSRTPPTTLVILTPPNSPIIHITGLLLDNVKNSAATRYASG